jgi:hypothetical protein
MLVCNFHVPLGFKVGSPSSGVGCDVALVFIFLCVGLMSVCVCVVMLISDVYISTWRLSYDRNM